MANFDTMCDGVVVFPGAFPPAIRDVVDRIAQNNPELSGEEVIHIALDSIATQVAQRRGSTPEPVA